MEAKKTLLAQLKGDSMSSLLNPSRGIRDDIERRGGTPKNHARENYQKIKAIAQQKKTSMELKEQAERLAKAVPTSSKANFPHVKSKVTGIWKSNENTSTVNNDLIDEIASSLSMTEISAEKRQGINKSPSFNDNPGASAVSNLCRKTKIGQVPAYLVRRKKDWALEEERRISLLSDENKYPGMRLVGEAERLETLSVLEKSLEKMTLKLRSLPIAADSEQTRRRKREIESKIGEIEKALDMFRQSKVYVSKDD